MISLKRVGVICLVWLAAAFQIRASTPLTFGTIYADALTVPGEVHTYTFTGAPGQRLYFDSQDSDLLPMYATLFSPSGANVYQSNDDYDLGPVVLTEPGAYQLTISGNGATTGAYSFRVLDLSNAASLTLGTTLVDQLSPPLACNIYQFHGTRGQRINLQSIAYSTNQAQWRLVTPVNSINAANTTILASGQISQSLGIVTLPMDGAYCLLVNGSVPGTTPLTFQVLLSDVSDTAVASSGFGTPHSGTVNANQTNSFTYTASAGLPVYYDNLDRSGQSLVVDLMDPSGTAVFSVSETGDAGPFTLPRSGTYTLNVRGPGGASGNFNFRLLDLTTSPILPLNSVVSNTLASPYQTDIYQLAGTAGQRLYYDSQLSALENVQLQLLGPDGQTPFSGNIYYDLGPFPLPFSTTYYLILQSGVSSSPNYVFQFLDIGTQPALPLNMDLTGTLQANTTVIYQLAGTGGEKLYFNAKGVSVGGGSWNLYGPNNVNINGAGLSGDFEQTLPYPGNYALVLSAANNPITYTNQVNTITYTTNSLTLGALVNDNIAHPGDQSFYTFTGTAGQRVYYAALSPNSPSMTLTLVSPSGTTVASGSPSYGLQPVQPITLPEDGPYFLQFDGNGHVTGPFAFKLMDIAVQPTLPLNSDLTGTLQPNDSIIYQVAGTSGKQLYFNAKGVSVGGGYWNLYGPNNINVNGTSLNADFEQILPYTGNYVVVLSGGSNPISYTNQVNTFGYTTNALTLGTATTSAIVNPGDQLYYTFTGTAGQRLYFDSRQTNYNNVSVTLYSPAGATIFSGYSMSDFGPFTLTQTGTYTLVLDAPGDTIGTVSFDLLDLAAATPATLGATISDSLSDQTQTRLYSFAGVAGQRVNLQSLSASGNQAVWELIGLADQTLGTEAYVSQNIGIITLPAAGTYVVAVVGQGASLSPVSYKVSLTDLSDSTAAASGFGVVHSGTVGASQTNTFTYTGPAGLPIFFDSQDASGQTLVVDLMAPDGTFVFFSIGQTSDSGPYTLTRSGTYTLSVRGSGGSSGNYSFRLLDLSASPTLSLNVPVSNVLTNPYETDFYQFTSSPGQRLIYNALTNDANYPSVYVQLRDPRWQAIGPGGDFQNNRGPFIVQYGGTCYLSFQNLKAVASGYSFQLLDVLTQPALPINSAVTNTLGLYPLEVYQFAGTAGQQLFFQGQPGNPSGYWYLYDVNNNTVPGSSSGLNGNFEVTLPYTATYTLELVNNGSSAGTEAFQVNSFSYFTNSYTIGTSVVDAINQPGERRFYAFTGTLGQRLIFDALTNDPPTPSFVTVQLLNPQGVQEGPISGIRSSSDRGPFALQESGTYTLVFDGYSASVGSFAFRLLDVTAQPDLPISTTVTTTLDLYPLLVYRYSGTAGQQLFFRGQPGNPGGNWTLYDPNNNVVSGSGGGLRGNFEVTLPISGTYSLLLNNGDTAGPEVFEVNPTVPGQVVVGPDFINVQIAPGTATPVWHSTPGKHYRLEYKNTLQDATWTAVGADVAATDVTASQVDSSIGNNVTRFYRVHQLD